MPRILSISYDHRLLRTRELLLQRMGHGVTSAEGFAQAVAILRSAEARTFDLVVLGHSIPHEDKRAIISHCRQTCGCPVLALTRVNEPPLTEATRSIDPSNTQTFVTAVHEVLSQGKADHAPK